MSNLTTGVSVVQGREGGAHLLVLLVSIHFGIVEVPTLADLDGSHSLNQGDSIHSPWTKAPGHQRQVRVVGQRGDIQGAFCIQCRVRGQPASFSRHWSRAGYTLKAGAATGRHMLRAR